MTSPQLLKIWGIAEANLKDARRYLVDDIVLNPSDESSLGRFDEYFSHNELGLALEEIAAIGREYVCKAEFWECLEAAAEVMELHELAVDFKERAAAEVPAYERDDGPLSAAELQALGEVASAAIPKRKIVKKQSLL